MKKSELTEIIREVIKETIRKVDGKYVVYPEKGGKRLGTHSTKKAAEKQLTAIHLNKENYADDKEKEIANDILSGLNEGKLDGVLTKMKQYAKKGLLTLAVIASVTQGLQAQGIAQSDIDAVNQQGIELVQQDYTVSRMTERLIVQTLGQQKFDAFVKLAKENGLRLGAGKSRMLNIARSQSRLNALSGINGQVTSRIVDSKIYKTSDGQYLVIQFLKVTVNENYADGEVKEVFTPSPLQNLVNDYLFLVTMNFIHIEKTGKTPKDVDALTQMIRHAKSDVSKLKDLSKEQLEKNKNNILQRIHDMLTYIISRMKAHMRPEEYEKRRGRLNKLLTLYKDAASVKENIKEGDEHKPMNPGILKKRLGKLSCSKVRAERSKLKDKGTTYAKALQRYLNYHCQ